jgi:hypothetical protein
MKTSELTGAALDWAVAKCENDIKRYKYGSPCFNPDTKRIYETEGLRQIGVNFAPSTDPSQAYPIIYRENIACMFDGAEWCAGICEQVNSGGDPVFSTRLYSGPTPLIAAMRCYVASKLGDTVDVPDELTGEIK